MPVLGFVDLQIDAGADFSFLTQAWLVNGVVQNLTGYTASMEARVNASDKTPWLNLTNALNSFGSGVIPQGVSGTVAGTIANQDTLNLPSTLGPLSFALWVTSPLIGAVAHPTGTGPLITTSGSPAAGYQFIINVTLGGTVGVAQFQWSSNGGVSYTSSVVTGSGLVLGATGVSVTFPAGTYSTTDQYTFAASTTGLKVPFQYGRLLVNPNLIT